METKTAQESVILQHQHEPDSASWKTRTAAGRLFCCPHCRGASSSSKASSFTTAQTHSSWTGSSSAQRLAHPTQVQEQVTASLPSGGYREEHNTQPTLLTSSEEPSNNPGLGPSQRSTSLLHITHSFPSLSYCCTPFPILPDLHTQHHLLPHQDKRGALKQMAQPTAGHDFWKTPQPQNGLGGKAGACREHTAHTDQMSLLRGHRELGQGSWARACVLLQAVNMTVTLLLGHWTFCRGLWLVLKRTLLLQPQKPPCIPS